MRNDIRVYNYYDDEPLITRTTQAKNYLDEKFANIHVEADMSEVEHQIHCSTHRIIDAIDDAKPCLCHLATKDDIHHAKHEIMGKIEKSKHEIIEEIDEKFVDLNEIINKD